MTNQGFMTQAILLLLWWTPGKSQVLSIPDPPRMDRMLGIPEKKVKIVEESNGFDAVYKSMMAKELRIPLATSTIITANYFYSTTQNQNTCFNEGNISSQYQGNNGLYKGSSKVDIRKGHLIRKDFMKRKEDKAATNRYTNGVPQNMQNNQGEWKRKENALMCNINNWAKTHCFVSGFNNAMLYLSIGIIPSSRNRSDATPKKFKGDPVHGKWFGNEQIRDYYTTNTPLNVPYAMWTGACCIATLNNGGTYVKHTGFAGRNDHSVATENWNINDYLNDTGSGSIVVQNINVFNGVHMECELAKNYISVDFQLASQLRLKQEAASDNDDCSNCICEGEDDETGCPTNSATNRGTYGLFHFFHIFCSLCLIFHLW